MSEEILETNSTENELIPVENPKAVVEAVLFAMGNSVELKKLGQVLDL